MGGVHEAWAHELDRLEADLHRAEASVADSRAAEGGPEAHLTWAPWEPPAMPGPIPADLVDRATGLLARFEVVRGSLSRSLSAIQGQLGFASKVGDISPAAGERRPVYLDVSC